MKTYDAYGRQKAQPSPKGGLVYVPVLLYDEILQADGDFQTVSIPSDIEHLMIILNARSDRSGYAWDNVRIAFNGDTTSGNYRSVLIKGGDTSIVASTNDTRQIGIIPAANASTNHRESVIIEIPNCQIGYFKNVLTRGLHYETLDTLSDFMIYGNAWENTNAITSVFIDGVNGDFLSSSRMQVFGYKLQSLGANAAAGVFQGRLTLTNGTPVTTSDVTAATSIWVNPYKGDLVTLYNGANWEEHRLYAREITVPSTTNTNFDTFCYLNYQQLNFETVNWTNDTTRATGITLQNGVYVKSGTPERLYIGTGRTTGTTGQIEDSKEHRFLYNYYNQKKRWFFLSDETGHTYGTGAWRYFNNDTSLFVDYVVGVAEDLHEIGVEGYWNNDYPALLGVGVNSLGNVPNQTFACGFSQRASSLTSLAPITGYGKWILAEYGNGSAYYVAGRLHGHMMG